MKLFFIKITMVFIGLSSWAQQGFHVFPVNHSSNPGSPNGNGSLEHPWDLQTALRKNAKTINGGDTIYVHQGTYNGRYLSLLSSTKKDSRIVVKPYRGEKVVINGNTSSTAGAILTVRGGGVIFRDLDITFLGKFSRRQGEEGFQKVSGVDHVSGLNCSFEGLRIYNVPGSGFGSWKRTGGSQIIGCKIFNNGYFSTKRGSGVGIYIQNESENTRLIKDNFIFNNYYKGIQVWSASSRPKHEYVKNVHLENNVVFNNGLPANKHVDNIIIASDDRGGLNVPKNIVLRSNILYHNIDFNGRSDGGAGPSLTIGYRATAPAENILIDKNVIIGKNYPLRLLHAKSIKLRDNVLAGGSVYIRGANLKDMNAKLWVLSRNKYFTFRDKPIRIEGHKNYTVTEFRSEFSPASRSNWSRANQIELSPVLYLKRNNSGQQLFDLALFNKDGIDVTVDFSSKSLKIGTPYKILNIETGKTIGSGVLNRSRTVIFPMGTLNGTVSNFGVFQIEFSDDAVQRRGFIGRLFKRWF